jgi:hypothetical protein
METQQTITEFLDETFGLARSNLSIAVRANKEMSELLSALSQDDINPKAASEIEGHAQHVKIVCEGCFYNCTCGGEDVEEGGDYYLRCRCCGWKIGWN